MIVDILILYSLLHIALSLFVTFNLSGEKNPRLSSFGCDYKALFASFRKKD